MTMRSAHPSSTPVVSKVPGWTDTRGSVVALANTSRMPALGSRARSSFTELAQSGCARRARVNKPVPDPILCGLDSASCQSVVPGRGRMTDVLDDIQRAR